MDGIMETIFGKYEMFLLILARVSGIFFISPFFSSQNIPISMKTGFSLLISILLAMVLNVNISLREIGFLELIFKELAVGTIIGFIGYAFFTAFYVMGQIIDMKIGFGMVNVMDPQHRVQVPIMGNFYYILAFLTLLSINGHHIVINALVDSYKFIPIGKFVFDRNIMDILINLIAETFKIGFQLSIPIVAIIFIVDLLLAIIARSIPQMNVFVVGMPLKIFIGLLFITISTPIFYSITMGIYNKITEHIYSFLKLFIKG
ncbi:MAG TPA: flagellar type III secretion system protein FliR [Tepidimicrobium sp.]|nr:flagellar type III secretion system protein FliR [Tepidimicrobium sp.]